MHSQYVNLFRLLRDAKLIEEREDFRMKSHKCMAVCLRAVMHPLQLEMH